MPGYISILGEHNNPHLYVDIDQGIHKGKSKVARNEKQKKTMWVFYTT